MYLRLAVPALVVFLTGCVSVNSSVLNRSFIDRPVPMEQVYVYLPGDEVPEHTRIAILTAEADADWTDESKMIDELRKEAGKLGANAIVLGTVEEPGTGERIVAAVLDTSAERRGRAVAIYVPSLARGGGGG